MESLSDGRRGANLRDIRWPAILPNKSLNATPKLGAEQLPCLCYNCGVMSHTGRALTLCYVALGSKKCTH